MLNYIIILWSLIFVVGCQPATKHKVLQIFFDGVPGGEKVQSAVLQNQAIEESVQVEKEEAVQVVVEPTVYRHPPFAERMCDYCHQKGSSNKPLEGRELCFSCHDDFLTGSTAKVKHYPVEEGMCVECHSPHQTDQKFFLKRKGQALCTECHDKGNLPEIHEDIGDEPCITCHHPHQGDEKLLR